jgi:predicted dehydrogenase
MKNVRLGIIGYGIMGQGHAREVMAGHVRRLRLTAVADADAGRLADLPPAVRRFTSAESMLASGAVDAVLIATPHHFHASVGIAALAAGLHVLVEKPVAAHKADAERLLAAHRGRQVFAVMLNQRTDPFYRKLRDLIARGELGAIQRINWIVTTWFRPQAYFNSGGWRATWAGEGGGVLINQAPHQLDLLWWLFGAPKTVWANCQLGRWHDIEVEDAVTACLEYPDGATGVFVTGTGEAPGTNRLEIAAENGRVVLEDDRIVWQRNAVPVSVFSRTTAQNFGRPPRRADRVFTYPNHGPQHNAVLRNFADAILDGRPLIAPAAEGLHSVELANAMLLSSSTRRAVELPMSAAAYARWLKRRIAGSTRGGSAGKRGT